MELFQADVIIISMRWKSSSRARRNARFVCLLACPLPPFYYTISGTSHITRDNSICVPEIIVLFKLPVIYPFRRFSHVLFLTRFLSPFFSRQFLTFDICTLIFAAISPSFAPLSYISLAIFLRSGLIVS